MDEPQLAEIDARANAATPGPWHRHAGKDMSFLGGCYVGTTPVPGTLASDFQNQAAPETVVAITLLQTPALATAVKYRENAEFIAHAREDVPALVAEVRRLRAFIVRHQPYYGSDAAVYAAEARQELGIALDAPDSEVLDG